MKLSSWKRAASSKMQLVHNRVCFFCDSCCTSSLLLAYSALRHLEASARDCKRHEHFSTQGEKLRAFEALHAVHFPLAGPASPLNPLNSDLPLQESFMAALSVHQTSEMGRVVGV